MMDLRQLYYFVTIVEERTFTKAATVLHISQPSLSAAIKNLEQKLGLTLLERSTRRVKLTKEGTILYKEAKQLISHVDYMKEEMNRLKHQGPPELTIGLIESAEFWIPQVLADFKKEFKKVHINLLEVLSLQDVQNYLTNFRIHLAITNQYIYDREHIQSIPIYEERLVILLPPNHPLKQSQTIHLEQLKDEDFIIAKKGLQTREDILATFRRAGIKPKIQFEIERFETACSLVENNLGITIIPENYAKRSQKHTYHIRHIEDPNVSRTVYIAYVKNRYLSPMARHFIKKVKQFFHSDRG